MMNLIKIIDGLKDGSIVPYLGMRIFSESKFDTDIAVPYDSDSLILALNDGRPMSSKLMYEFSRAAMNMEHSMGRKELERRVKTLFSKNITNNFVIDFIGKIKPHYIVDTNYDATVLKLYSDVEHTVIVGKSRIGADLDRYELYEFNIKSASYTKILPSDFHIGKPIIFKPMGCVAFDTYVISDADFVDWITEAMGGFSMPKQLKEYKKEKSYLMLGLTFDKDTQRMVANEITLDSNGGYFVFESELTKNGNKFIEAHNIEHLNISNIQFVNMASEYI